MNEREKMQNGLPYDATDKELLSDRTRCKDFCLEYNKTSFKNRNKMNNILKKILGKTGTNFWIEPAFYCDYGYNIEIGENFYSNHNLVILDCARVKFGNNVFIGPNCGIYTASHPIDSKERNTGLEHAKPINIGNNVWIGGNVCILPGVTIGDNCVIGAGSVVTKDIPSNKIAIGNPCKIYKEISGEQT